LQHIRYPPQAKFTFIRSIDAAPGCDLSQRIGDLIGQNMYRKILGSDEKPAPRGFDGPCLLGIPGRGLPDEGKSRSTRSGSLATPAITSAQPASPTVSFSTDDVPEDVPEKDRIAMWRDHFGRTALRVEIEPTEEEPFEANLSSRILPGLHLLEGGVSAGRLVRTRQLVADGNDDLLLVINRKGSFTVSARGHEVSLHEGDGLLRSSDDVAVFERRAHGHSLSLRIPRSLLSSLVVDVDGAIMRTIPRQSGALQLLGSYMKALIDEPSPGTSELQHLAASHVSDLAALTLGATRDAESTAKVRGMPAARLRAAKAYLIENSHRRDLSIGTVAARLGVTPRYLQRLFEADGKTFSTWLLNQRLIRAHRMLCKAQFSEQPVSAIAYDVGFGDLSYFNRCFRKLYGATPRDVREAASN
jgi:AraC-like DNA-binding protein